MAKGAEIDTIDVNNRMFDTRVISHTPIFFDEAYYRTLSKIAFEWYCKENNVIGYRRQSDYNPFHIPTSCRYGFYYNELQRGAS